MIALFATALGFQTLAVDQCLRANEALADTGRPDRVSRLVLTASGGPFRGRTRSELGDVTVEDALAHPTWSMGPKITVDSSTLMNKGVWQHLQTISRLVRLLTLSVN